MRLALRSRTRVWRHQGAAFWAQVQAALLRFRRFLPAVALVSTVGVVAALAQTETIQGELKRLSRIWDGTDVWLIDGSGNGMVGDGSGPLTVDGTVAATQSGAWNVTNISGTVSLPTGAATSALQLPDGHNVTVDNAGGAAAVNVQDGGNTITVDGTVAATQSGTWNINNVSGTVSLPTGAATAANQLANGHTVTPIPGASGGTSISRTVSAASTNATNVKASAGQVYQVVASNVNAAARFVHLYNTSGTPSCGTSIIATFIVPGNSTGGGTNITLDPGSAFGTGIGFCITTANDGTGSVSASDVVLNVFYK